MDAATIEQEESDVIDIDQEQDETALVNNPETEIISYAFDQSAQSKAKLLATIATLKKQYSVVPTDLTVKENYKLVADTHSLFKKTLTSIEKVRKEKTAKALAEQRFYNGAAKEVVALIEDIKAPFTKAKQEFDTAEELKKREAALAEERRIDGIVERIASIKALVEANISSSSAVIKGHMEGLEQDDIVAEWAMEYVEKAREAIQETMAKLGELWAMKLQQETFAAEQAKAEEERKAKAEADRIKREKEVAEEKAKLEAERAEMEAEKARMAAEQAEKDRKAREELEAERAKLAEEQAKIQEEQAKERARLEAEQAERDRIQREKDAATAAELQRTMAELEALKKQAEPVQVVEVKEEVKEERNDRPFADPMTIVNGYGKSDEEISQLVNAKYKESGQAMIKFIGSREVTRRLLDAIIKGEIPNISFSV